MAFPDPRDRRLIRKAEEVTAVAEELSDWVAAFGGRRKVEGLMPISEADEHELLAQRRRARNLYNSARVPVAAAIYGPSQVGKSLFIGRMLEPMDASFSPLGRDEAMGEPGYYAGLSFTDDLNPQSGSNEATALVTRFTTRERTDPQVLAGYPALARGLTRAEWLSVLGRGFRAECRAPEAIWDEASLEALFGRCDPAPDGAADRRWRADLLDAYAHLRRGDPLRLPVPEAAFNGLLARYPLSDGGYTELASTMFWGGWPELTAMFRSVLRCLAAITAAGRPGLLVHWAGVRFLLDSQRTATVENERSRVFRRVAWEDFRLVEKGGWRVLDFEPGRGGGAEDLAVLQAALLELVIPILPHRLDENWRRAVEEIDVLDIPGMRAGRDGAEGGTRTSAETLEERMEIVKRGKVLYLFDRYIEDLQVQTLLLLVRGGNLEVRGQMKSYVNRWGAARYGKDWPQRVRDVPPALFVGLTGIDEEFRDRSTSAGKELYENRVRQLIDTLGPVMTDFGARNAPFTNAYPLRYPGTWDASESQRARYGPEKWQRARAAFLESEGVRRHVAEAERRWDAAMDDRDGGLSLIGDGFRQSADAAGKQRDLERSLEEVRPRLLGLARSWLASGDANRERERRRQLARRVVDWLRSEPSKSYSRVHGLSQALALREGDAWALADFSERRPAGERIRTESPELLFGEALRGFLGDWAAALAPDRWREQTDGRAEGAPWIGLDDFLDLARSLKDYLLSDAVLTPLRDRLLKIVDLRLKDEAVRRHARRKYVRLALNDVILNLGLSVAPIVPVDEAGLAGLTLMRPFVRRWASRLEPCCAAGAGGDAAIPPGNEDLRALLAEWGDLPDGEAD
ncbi:Putative bacterial virulence factor [Aquisphaera giovannonii]|uniref:Bacterial virulence factor n=1 Tax=Aquisphaera giovannonii TaxID=406548 RepID=A0A5B9VUK0_9BACT|nr:virulence factor SrfC family protein [Aquisphaera giovannonii]QEH32063.1 Putative bacterial virulence factor [Aquisphaera giovannonii]